MTKPRHAPSAEELARRKRDRRSAKAVKRNPVSVVSRSIVEYDNTMPVPNEAIRLTMHQYKAVRLLDEGAVLWAYVRRGIIHMETEDGEDLYIWKDGGWVIEQEQRHERG